MAPRKARQIAPGLHRVPSRDDAMDSMMNKNVNWIGPRFFAFYAIGLVGFELLVRMLLVTPGLVTWEQGLTMVHAGHGVVNFFVMHYLQGTPGELQDQGDYSGLSWWEQLDDGTAWTAAHKVLILIPMVLFLVTSHLTKYQVPHLIVNLAVLALCVVPKLPQLNRIRFGRADDE